MKRLALVLSACAANFTLAAACVGSDPEVGPTVGDDASTPDGVGNPTPDSATSDSGGDGSGGPGDAANDADADAGPPACSTGPTDASSHTFTTRWSAVPVTSTVVGAMPTVLGQYARSDCTILLEGLETAGAPPTYVVYMEKQDSTAGSCPDPKGFLPLFTSYVGPAGFLAKSALDTRLFVVVYAHKNSPSGSSPVQLSMEQRDFKTGDVAHAAHFAVVGNTEPIPPVDTAVALTASGCDVVLQGTGNFPGVTGINSGGAWTATYLHFLAPEAQDPSFADSAHY